MPTPNNRQAAAVANSVAFLQFAWKHPAIISMMDRAGLSAAVGYFPVRLAPLGNIPPVVAQALMPFFPKPLVAKMVEQSREVVPAEGLNAIVHEGLSAAAVEAFGTFQHLAELTDLLATAAGACDLDGRPITAGWASYEWEEDAARLFGAATVLREHRGEGHWFALAAAGVTGDVAHVFGQLHRGLDRNSVRHGYKPDQVEAAIAVLEARGWVAGDRVTPDGEEFHARIEAVTDELDAAPWEALGEDGVARVIELGSVVPRFDS